MPSAIISTEISAELVMGRGGGGGGGGEGGDGGGLGATGGQLRIRAASVQVTVASIISVLAFAQNGTVGKERHTPRGASLRPPGVIPLLVDVLVVPLFTSIATLHLGVPLQPI